MGKTAIPWVARPGTVPRPWNVTRGCTPVSAGCRSCYARIYHERFRKHRGLGPWHEPVALPEKLGEPLKWKAPSTVFVCAMSDLFHEAIPDRFIFEVLTMAWITSDQHTFIFLTKRPGRMLGVIRCWASTITDGYLSYFDDDEARLKPLPFWMGVTAENQIEADERIPYLAQIQTAVRFVSCEPLLGPLNLRHWLPALDWVIVGSESGPGARPMDEDWVRSIRNDCKDHALNRLAHTIPFFYKQRMVDGRKEVNPLLGGERWTQWPA